MHSLAIPVLYKDNVALPSPTVSAISWGAEHGVLRTIQLALQFGADIQRGVPEPHAENCRHELAAGAFGTPLHQAAKGGHDEVVQYLLDQGADSLAAYTLDKLCGCEFPASRMPNNDSGTDRQWLPLHSAICGNGQVSTIKILTSCERWSYNVSLPVEVKPGHEFYVTAAQSAAVRGDLAILGYLLQHGCPVDNNIFIYAAMCRRKESIRGLVKMCVSRGLFSFPDNVPNLRSFSPLEHLCSPEVGALVFAREILKYEGSFRQRDVAFHKALLYLRYLPQPLMVNGSGAHQTEDEARQDARDLVEALLVKTKETPGQLDHRSVVTHGRTALGWEACCGLWDVVEALMEAGADLLVEDHYHNTPIVSYLEHYAARHRNKTASTVDSERVGRGLLAGALNQMPGEHSVITLFEQIVRGPHGDNMSFNSWPSNDSERVKLFLDYLPPRESTFTQLAKITPLIRYGFERSAAEHLGNFFRRHGRVEDLAELVNCWLTLMFGWVDMHGETLACNLLALVADSPMIRTVDGYVTANSLLILALGAGYSDIAIALMESKHISVSGWASRFPNCPSLPHLAVMSAMSLPQLDRVLEALGRIGADFEAPDKFGRSPLTLSMMLGFETTAKNIGFERLLEQLPTKKSAAC